MTHLNTQTKDSSGFNVGLGPAYLDPWVDPTAEGVTPSTEVGYYSKVDIKFQDSRLTAQTGTPLLDVDEYTVSQADTITLTFDEYNALRFTSAVSMMCMTDEADPTTPKGFKRGGTVATNKFMLMLRQDLMEGRHTEWRFWKVTGDGNLTKSFDKVAKQNTYSITFKCLKADRDWCNNALDGNYYSEVEEVSAYDSLT